VTGFIVDIKVSLGHENVEGTCEDKITWRAAG